MVGGLVILLLFHFGVTQETCTHSAKLDLQIIVDSSGSVGEKNFHVMMEKISRSLISQFDIGADKTRVALFKYGCPRLMENEFYLDTFSDKEVLQATIENTKYEKGCTMTAMAMKKALDAFKAKERKDSKTSKACIVFTDGEATDAPKVPAQSKLWADDGATVFAIGIGKKISNAGLKAIAGSSERVLTVDNFDKIGDLAKSLLNKVCDTIATPWDPERIRLHITRLIDASIDHLEAFDAKGRPLKSLTHDQKSYVKFVNDSPYTVTLWWIDYKGKGRSYGDIAPNGVKIMNTFVTHPWVVINKATKKFMVFTNAEGKSWPYFFPPSWNQPNNRLTVRIHAQTRGGASGQVPPPTPWNLAKVNLHLLRFRNPYISSLSAVDAKGRRLRSISHNLRSYVRFFNNSPFTVTLWWINYKGKGHSYGDIPPKGSKVMSTFVTHPWVALKKGTNEFMLFHDAVGGTWPYFFPPYWNRPRKLLTVTIQPQNTAFGK